MHKPYLTTTDDHLTPPEDTRHQRRLEAIQDESAAFDFGRQATVELQEIGDAFDDDEGLVVVSEVGITLRRVCVRPREKLLDGIKDKLCEMFDLVRAP